MASFSYLYLYSGFFLLLFMNLQAAESAKAFGNETDRMALLAIKDSVMGDPLGALSSWNGTLHFCKWPGVTCSRRHQRVITLDLSSLNLEGPMSPHVGNLSFLRRISFQENNFNGEIPREIGSLFRLQHLNLSFNFFQGEILTKLTNCSDLRVVNLESNKFTGNIPVEVGSLSGLNLLWLNKNDLTGSIPPSLGNLSSLNILSLGANRLEGSIPNDLGRLTNLEYFQVSVNELSGLVPLSLYNISSINKFVVAANQFHGSLPSDMGLTLPNLQRLWLGYNQFTGPIPVTLWNASKLESFDVYDNSFVGPVTIGFGGFENLSRLNFGENQLGTGAIDDLSFLASLSNCSGLQALGLDGNGFGGILPNSVANLSANLILLAMGRNQLTGSIPSGIENLVNLILLGLENNFLTGTIPSSIGKLQKLQSLYLHGNRLSGEIPNSVGNMTLLNDLYLDGNSLWGRIPESLGKFRLLKALDLSQNNLTGTIPKQVIGLSSLSLTLNLAQNLLTGSLPSEVGSLINLVALDISQNKLSGEIPSTLGSCVMLSNLNMKNNNFQGIIPSSLSNLKGIKTLDLSSNHLSGQIPKYLQEFPLLQYLNLSFNDIEGEVPIEGLFKNGSAISVLGNRKLCGGIPELQLPNCTLKASKEKRHSISLKVLVPTVCGVSSLMIILSVLVICYWKRFSKMEPSISSSIVDRYRKVSYRELSKATEGFSSSNLIGVGSHGSVYKGILDGNEKFVAVKVLNHERRGALRSFLAECEALRNVRHRNLVKIITACSSVDYKGEDFRALVFEYLPNGNLDKWLHQEQDGQNNLQNLSFMQRLNIAIEVASALEYLHHHCQTTVAHCDLKPSNILLDDDLSARVGDFGLSKLLGGTGKSFSENQTSSFAIKGSLGYVPPEYGFGGEASTQGDVYSYGILLLEMFTGKRPTEDLFKDGLSLHEFAKMAIPARVMEIVDPWLLVKDNVSLDNVENSNDKKARVEECLISIFNIGLTCSLESPGERMKMIDVANKLRAVRDIFVGLDL